MEVFVHGLLVSGVARPSKSSSRHITSTIPRSSFRLWRKKVQAPCPSKRHLQVQQIQKGTKRSGLMCSLLKTYRLIANFFAGSSSVLAMRAQKPRMGKLLLTSFVNPHLLTLIQFSWVSCFPFCAQIGTFWSWLTYFRSPNF